MANCCKSGYRWNGTPKGSETTIAGHKTYVTGNTANVGILMVHDVFGWTLPNLRLLADYYAENVGATVYLPDFFDGEVVSPEIMDDPEKRAKFDISAFVERHSKQIRYPGILTCTKALKERHQRVGAVGFCYGGWAVFQLAAQDQLLDCVSTAHPSLLEESEIDSLTVPTQILAPEHDPAFTKDLKEYCNKTIPGRNIPYEFIYFPALSHGFASRCDLDDPFQRKGLERAARSAVNWFNEWLHQQY